MDMFLDSNVDPAGFSVRVTVCRVYFERPCVLNCVLNGADVGNEEYGTKLLYTHAVFMCF